MIDALATLITAGLFLGTPIALYLAVRRALQALQHRHRPAHKSHPIQSLEPRGKHARREGRYERSH